MKILLFFALAAVAQGVQYDGLRVRSGWSDAMADREYFFRIPRTISEADNGHWRRTERPPGPLPELKMYCLPDRHVCPLFDSAGFVSGLQIALAVDEFESLAIPPERIFVRWRIADVDGGRTRDFWTLTQFYVTEESLKAGAGPTIQNNNTLQDGGVWVTGPNGKLMKIPTSEAELNTTAYVKQNCIPNMGIHYYYNMTPAMNCDDSFPWFALTLRGSLIGTGFQMYGRMPPRDGERDYFERPAVPFATGLTIPLAPQCLTEWVQSYGVITMHIYYIDRPWTITCRAGDSVRPGSVQDRVLFDGVRYASSVGDQVRSVFMG